MVYAKEHSYVTSICGEAGAVHCTFKMDVELELVSAAVVLPTQPTLITLVLRSVRASSISDDSLAASVWAAL